MRTSINISLPEAMRSWVDAQVGRGGYGTVSEYFRELLRAEQKRQLREEIDAKLLEALNSGKPIDVTPEYWEDLRREARERLAARKPQ